MIKFLDAIGNLLHLGYLGIHVAGPEGRRFAHTRQPELDAALVNRRASPLTARPAETQLIELTREHDLRLTAAAGVEIVCCAGTLWITEQGDGEDFVLTEGSAHTIRCQGLTLIAALRPATLSIDTRHAAGAGWSVQETARSSSVAAARQS